jgi:hypothetical protein
MHWLLVAGAAAVAAVAACFKPFVLPALLEAASWPQDEVVGQIPAAASPDELRAFYGGKRVLIVGGTRGVGFGIARAVVGAGGSVALVGRSAETARRALRELNGGSDDGPRATFIRGDIGSIAGAKETVQRIVEAASQGSGDGDGGDDSRFDHLVVTAAIFPDWTGRRPHQQEDGIDSPFAVAVVGRYIIYKNMPKFLKPDARVMNVLASGQSMDKIEVDWDLAGGKRDPKGLSHSIMTFACGNELVLRLVDADPVLSSHTRASTHPGFIGTDLQAGQGPLFHAIASVALAIAGITVEEGGLRQASVLASDRLHGGSLTYVSADLKGRVPSEMFMESVKEHLPRLREFLQRLSA